MTIAQPAARRPGHRAIALTPLHDLEQCGDGPGGRLRRHRRPDASAELDGLRPFMEPSRVGASLGASTTSAVRSSGGPHHRGGNRRAGPRRHRQPLAGHGDVRALSRSGGLSDDAPGATSSTGSECGRSKATLGRARANGNPGCGLPRSMGVRSVCWRCDRRCRPDARKRFAKRPGTETATGLPVSASRPIARLTAGQPSSAPPFVEVPNQYSMPK